MYIISSTEMSFLELSFFHVFLTIFNCLNIWQLFFFPKRSGKLLILFPLASFLTYRLNYLFFRLYTYSFPPILIVCIFRSFFVPFLSHDYSRSSSGLVMLPSLMESSITDGEMLFADLIIYPICPTHAQPHTYPMLDSDPEIFDVSKGSNPKFISN